MTAWLVRTVVVGVASGPEARIASPDFAAGKSACTTLQADAQRADRSKSAVDVRLTASLAEIPTFSVCICMWQLGQLQSPLQRTNLITDAGLCPDTAPVAVGRMSIMHLIMTAGSARNSTNYPPAAVYDSVVYVGRSDSALS